MADILERYCACIMYAGLFVCVIGTVPEILANSLTESIGHHLSDEMILSLCPVVLAVAFSFTFKLYFKETYSTVFGSYVDLVFSYIMILVFRHILVDLAYISDLTLVISFVCALVTTAGIDLSSRDDY